MRSVVVFSVFSALALGAATAAIADGAPVSLTPAPTVRDGWSGLYIGLGGGASRVDRSGSNDKKKETCSKNHYYVSSGKCGHNDDMWVVDDHHTSENPFGEEDWKGFGTVQIGYDHLFGTHLLIGAFADVDIYGGGEDDLNHKHIDGSFELNHTWNVGGRIGALVMPHVLLYGVGGYTQAGIDKSVDFKWKHLDDFDTPKGWFAGGGAEVQLHRGVSLKFEYRFADYGSISDDASWTKQKGCDWYRKSFSADDDLEVQSVRALLVFRADEPDAPVALK